MRLAAGLALAAALAAPLADGDAIPPDPRQLALPDRELELPSAEGRRIPLSRGATLYLFEDPTLPLVDVAVAWRVGTFLEPAGRAGLARLTAAMLRRGGTEALDADAFDLAVDQLGAQLEAGVGETRGGASLSATRWTFDRALELFVDMLARPRFQDDRLEVLRRNLIDSLARRNDDPLDLLEREWQWLILGEKHFSTQPPTPASVMAMTRAELKAFHRRHFRPEALVLAISGDVKRQELVPRLEELLASWPAAEPLRPPLVWPPPPPSFRPRPGLYVAPADTPQAKVILGHSASTRSPPSEREAATLSLVNQLLGGTDAISRISGRLRAAEGLVYRADAHLDTGLPWPRDFRVFFESDSSNVPRALRLAREEIERLRREAPHPRELEVVRRSALSSLRLAFDTAEKIAGWYAEDELLGRPHAYWERRDRFLRQIDGEEVRRAAERWLRPSRLVYLVVGPYRELVGDDSRRRALERAAGHRATILPPRDPLTLQPIPTLPPDP